MNFSNINEKILRENCPLMVQQNCNEQKSQKGSDRA